MPRRPAKRLLVVAVGALLLVVVATALLVRASGPSLADPPDGWRYESRGDLVVMVPDSWVYRWAPDSAWCTDETEPDAPYVDSSPPVYAMPASGCDALGVGIEGVPDRYLQTHLFFPPPGTAREGTLRYGDWTQYTRRIGDTYVAVLTDKAHLQVARRVIESARQVDEDQFGCAPHAGVEKGALARPPDPFDVEAVDHVDAISVCQYFLGRDAGWSGLIASRQLTGSAAEDLLAAIKAAPVGGGPDDPSKCLPDYYDYALTVRLVGDGTHELFGYYDACGGNGLDDGTHLRALTAANCPPLFGDRVVRGFEGTAYAVCYPGDSAAEPPRSAQRP